MDYLARTMLHGNAETLVLAMLAKGDTHPYRLRWDLSRLSHGHFHLAFGRLYPLLKSMEQRRLVRARSAKGRGEQVRTVYSITRKGRAELDERVRRWNRFVEHMNLVLAP